MAKVGAFSVDGLELFFYSNDHIPPHFHVVKPGEWEIRVNFMRSTAESLEYSEVWSKKSRTLKSKERKELREKIVAHRADLLREWEKKVDY